MPCPNKKTVRSYLTAEEYNRLVQSATRSGLSISQFIRQVCLGYQPRTFEHEEFKLELIKMRSDLGRLGGLFKLALSGQSLPDDFTGEELRLVLNDITIIKEQVREAVTRL